MNPIFIVPILASITACSTPSRQDNLSESKAISARKENVVSLFGETQVHRYIFDNGLKLLVIEDHSSPTFAYQTWFNVGSRDEEPGKTGLAHLFEHMMFKETKNLKDGEFDRLLESAGAEGENAFTSRDYTAYIQELPKERLDLIAKAEADRMKNLVINQKAFQTEREVVQNERRFRNENSPDGLMDQELFHLAFSKHPYHWPVIGYQEDLDRMTDEDALKFYQSYYSPNHATIIVVGDVNAKGVRDTIQKYYGNYTNQSVPAREILEEPPQKSPRRKQLKLNIQVEKLLLGYPIPAVSHPDMPILSIIQSIFAGGKSSRLHRALVETGIATAVDASDLDNRDPSLFEVSVNLQNGKRATQAEQIILKEFDRLSKELVTEKELQRAKNKINFSFYEGMTSNFRKAYFLGHYETITGDFKNGVQKHEKMQTVTAKEVLEVAKRYLNPKRRTVITGVKK